MKPLTLSPAEVKQALETGEVTLERVMEPQPLLDFSEILKRETWYYKGKRDPELWPIFSPFGQVSCEQLGIAEDSGDLSFTTIFLTHKDTKVEQRNGVWVWVGKMEVNG